MESLRKYGERPYSVVVLHGGPGTPGEMAPVARRLARTHGVLEPLQTEPGLEEQLQALKDALLAEADLPVRLVGTRGARCSLSSSPRGTLPWWTG